jgi:adenylate cyclase
MMGIFIGNYKNTSAAKCALQINYAFLKIVRPMLEAKYENLRSGPYKLAHYVGVNTSNVLAVRGGVRDNNDLVWVGRSPNIAAELSTIRNSPYHSFITEAVFTKLNDEAKYGGPEKKPMWETCTWSSVKTVGINTLHRSSWFREP